MAKVSILSPLHGEVLMATNSPLIMASVEHFL